MRANGSPAPVKTNGEECCEGLSAVNFCAPALPAGVLDKNTSCSWVALELEAHVCELVCERESICGREAGREGSPAHRVWSVLCPRYRFTARNGLSRSRVAASARSSRPNSYVLLTLFVQLVRMRNRSMSETISRGGFSSANA